MRMCQSVKLTQVTEFEVTAKTDAVCNRLVK